MSDNKPISLILNMPLPVNDVEKTLRAGSRQEGFTMPEVLFALVILTVGLLGMAALTGSLVSAGALSRDRVSAVTLAQGKLEELKNIPFSSLGDEDGGTDSHGAFTRQWDVSTDTPIADAATVSVTVSWPAGGATRTIMLRTIRAK